MEKEFIPYELALKLKEIGFDERCLAGYYNDGKSLWFFRFHKNSEREPTVAKRFATAPLWQQAFDWFRKEYKFHYIIEPLEIDGVLDWYFSLRSTIKGEHKHIDFTPYYTYEEAREACLLKLIELVENEKN